jgi:drug/metabolite transporter (DMT)-like permease
MDKKLQTFMGIMLFYAILACVLGPLVFYYVWNKSLKTAGTGFIVGSILSILLWLFYGKKMV